MHVIWHASTCVVQQKANVSSLQTYVVLKVHALNLSNFIHPSKCNSQTLQILVTTMCFNTPKQHSSKSSDHFFYTCFSLIITFFLIINSLCWVYIGFSTVTKVSEQTERLKMCEQNEHFHEMSKCICAASTFSEPEKFFCNTLHCLHRNSM